MYGYTNTGILFKILIPIGEECDLERILEGLGFNYKTGISNGFKRIMVMNRVSRCEEDLSFLCKLMDGYGFDKVSIGTVTDFWSAIKE